MTKDLICLVIHVASILAFQLAVSENVTYQVILRLFSMAWLFFVTVPFVMPLQMQSPATVAASAYYSILAGIFHLLLAFLAISSLTILARS